MRTAFVRIKIILVLIFLLRSASAQSQTGKIEGFVFDPKGKPISDLHVLVENTILGDVTDMNGYFIVENIKPGTYTLKLDHIGYKTKFIKDIEVRGNQTVTLEPITLEVKILELDGIIVTATRTDRHITEVSNSVNIVSESRIRERNAKTSSEALREETGIFVQKTSHGGGSAIIRGLSSNQILILVDGIRLNNSLYRLGNHQYLTTIDNAIVHQMEVVRGPTSVLYGSDAMGGTINIITKKPNLQSAKFDVNYRLLSRYASADEEKTARAELSLQGHKFAFQTGFSYKDYNDLKRGKNSHHPQIEKSTNGLRQTPTGFTAYDFDSKMIYQPTPLQTFILAYQMSKKIDVPRYDKYENNSYLRWVYQPQNRNLMYLTYENNLQNKLVTSLRATISYHRQEEGREQQQNSTSPLTKEKDDVHTIGLSLQLNSIFRQHLLTYGADMYLDHVFSERFFIDTENGTSEKDIRGRYPDGSKYNSFGLFLQDEIRMTPEWRVIPGIRFSHFTTHFTIPTDPTAAVQLGDIKQNFQSLTGSLGVIRKLTSQIFFNVNIGQAFRAPNLSDITKLGESKGNTYEVPNPNLVPEKMLNFDMGLKFNSQRLKATASVYYAMITDLLASAETTVNGSPTIELNENTYKVKTKKNIGNAFIRGFEASIDYPFHPHLSLHANVSTTYGQNTTNNEPVGGIPPTFGLIGMKWSRETMIVDLYMRIASKQDRLSADDMDDTRIPAGGTPGWYTINFRSGFHLRHSAKLQLAVENILDTNYREHGSGVNGPGRNFIVSLEVKP